MRVLFGVCVLFLAFSAWTAHAQKGAAIAFLPDSQARLTIAEASSRDMAGEYQTYIPSFMAFSRLPDDFNGAVWLRFTLGPLFERPSGPVRVDLGALLPGTSRLYTPNASGGFTVMESLPSQGTFILPEGEPFPDVFYARIDGAPGLWFRPTIGPASDPVSGMMGDIPIHLILAGVFGFVMLIMLIRYVRKAEEWRLWAAITAGCGIVAAVIPATPPAGQAFAPLHAGAVMAPGLILVFFAHTARHLLASPRTMPGSDRFLAFYYLIGGALALLPLTPGFLWVSRYLPLAALLFIPLLPVAMISLSGSLRGGPAFLCACLLPVAGVAVSSWEITSVDASMIRGLGGLFGTALGLLVLAFIGTANNGEETENAADDVFDSLDKACPSSDLVLGPVRPRTKPPVEDRPEDDLAAGTAERPAGQFSPAAHAAEPGPAPEEARKNTPEKPRDDTEHYPELSLFSGEKEDMSPEPEPVRAPEKPAASSLPPAMPEKMPSAPTVSVPAPAPIAITDDGTEPSVDEPAAAGRTAFPPFMPGTPLGHGRKILFDLPTLVKEAYDGPALIAERKGLGMSWYIAPRTGRLFEGEADLLDSALRQLLRDMVEAMDKGNVRLNVRRMRNSADAGHVVFTVSEWDARQTSGARTMAGLAEAWSLAEKTGGMFSVEHSPAGGTTVVFSAAFAAMDKTVQETAATDDPSPRDALSAPRADLAAAPAVPRFSDDPGLAAPLDRDLAVRPRPSHGIADDDLAGEAETERDPLRVIITDTTASGRARASAALAGSPYAVLECATPPAAYALYTRHPSGLLLMNADMPEVDIAAAIRDVHTEDSRNGRSPALFAVLVEHERQATRMMEAGAARTLLKPVQTKELLALVTDLLPVPDPAAETAKNAPLPVPPANVLPPVPPAKALESELREPAPEPRAARPSPLQVRIGGAPQLEGGTRTKPEAAPPPVPEASQLPKATVSVKPSAKTVVAQSKPAPAAAPEKSAPVPAAPVRNEAAAPDVRAAATVPDESPAKAETAASPETVLHNALADIPPVRENDRSSPAVLKERTEAEQSGIFSTALPDDAPGGTSGTGEQPAKTDGKAETAPAKGTKDEPGLALLDMIITDEEEEAAPAAAPAAPARNGEPEGRQAQTASPVSGKIQTAPSVSGKIQAAAPARPKPENAAPAQSKNPVTGANGAASGGGTAQPGASILLPGEEDSIFKDMVPLVPGLIFELTDALADAARGREEKSPLLVQQAAGRVAGKAESFGLTKLERMARCVERAAAADDVEPMECVLADLENWVARYKEALTKVHRDMQW